MAHHQERKKAYQRAKKDEPRAKEETQLLHLASKTAPGLNRKERKALKHERLLTLRQEPKIKVGDSIWLSLHLQKTYEDVIGRDNEGPFKVVHHENFVKYQISLGDGKVISVPIEGILPCFDNT